DHFFFLIIPFFRDSQPYGFFLVLPRKWIVSGYGLYETNPDGCGKIGRALRGRKDIQPLKTGTGIDLTTGGPYVVIETDAGGIGQYGAVDENFTAIIRDNRGYGSDQIGDGCVEHDVGPELGAV